MDKIAINNMTYDIITFLGKGKGGYSYLVSDINGQYVYKQIHHEPCDYYEFGNKIESEINDYHKLSLIGIRMPKLLSYDMNKECLLKEYIDGPTIYELVYQDKMKESYLEDVRKICELLYQNATNIDYFPTNFVVKNDLLYYIDYECNDYMAEWNFENWGSKYWTRSKEFLAYAKDHPLK